jgi:hypothetical protein
LKLSTITADNQTALQSCQIQKSIQADTEKKEMVYDYQTSLRRLGSAIFGDDFEVAILDRFVYSASFNFSRVGLAQER